MLDFVRNLKHEMPKETHECNRRPYPLCCMVIVYSGNRETYNATEMKGLTETSKECGYTNILNYSPSQHLILIAVRIKQTLTKETRVAIYRNAIIKTTFIHIQKHTRVYDSSY